VPVGFLDGVGQLTGVVDLGDADRRTAPRGLDEHGEAELAHPVGDAVGVAVPLPRRDRQRRHQWQASGAEHDLHVGLVHAHRTGEHARADIADPRHLEHPLDGAVLTPRSVQEGEHDVDLTERPRWLRRLVDDQVGGSGVARQCDRGPRTVDLRQLVGSRDLQQVRVPRLEHPAAVGGDADRHDVVLVAVDGLQHAAGRHARDGVLAGPAAEDNGDALPARPCSAGLAHRTRP
jgi:hypothetical protein